MRFCKERNIVFINACTLQALIDAGLIRYHPHEYDNMQVTAFKAKGHRMHFHCKGIKFESIIEFIYQHELSHKRRLENAGK